jgi:hypothetical protein
LYSISHHFPQFQQSAGGHPSLVSLVDTNTVACFLNDSFLRSIAPTLNGHSLAFCTVQTYDFHIVSNAEQL